MARVEGLDPKETSLLMRLVCGRVRKMLGKYLTPQKIQVYGLSDDEIAALLRDDCPRFSAGEQALIPVADRLRGTPADVSDVLFA
jgi:hypothetical protein